MKEAVVNTFAGGLNQDLDNYKRDNKSYFSASNIRLITQEGSGTLAIENLKGHDYLKAGQITIELPTTTNVNKETGKLIGYATIQEDIVIFVKEGIYGYIAIIPYDEINETYVQPILLVEAEFNFGNYIEAIGLYEADYLKKVYWVDGTNIMRYINVSPDIDNDGSIKNKLLQISYTYNYGKPAEQFDIVPNMYKSNTAPAFSQYTQGNLMTGLIQYTYRLYKRNGARSNFASASDLIPLTSLNNQDNSPNVNTGKGVIGTITFISPVPLDIPDWVYYDYIEIIAIHYERLNDTPTVKVVERRPIEQSITFIDEGIYIDSYIYEELIITALGYIPKTLVSKDGRLFIGNIKEDYIDVNYDARAYRFGKQSGALSQRRQAWLWQINDPITSGLIPATIIDGTAPIIDFDISETLDCINRSNLLQYDTDFTVANWDFRYKSDGDTMGGEGKNVSYTFEVVQELIDLSTNTWADNIKVLRTFGGGSGNYQDGIYRTFHRDEIYRFGIVFIDNKGRSSTVKWISDIRMPDYLDLSTHIYSYNAGNTYANYIKPVFTVTNIPLNDNGTVMDYQIVYVPRQTSDRSVLMTGMMGSLANKDLVFDEFYGKLDSAAQTGKMSYEIGANKLIEYVSPEITFNKNYKLNNNHVLYSKVFYYFTVGNAVNPQGNSSEDLEVVTKFNDYRINSGAREVTTFLDAQITNGNADRTLIYNINNNKVYNTVIINNTVADDRGTLGTCILGETADYFTQAGNIFKYTRHVAIRVNGIVQYGGTSYIDRTRNIYIPVSKLNNGEAIYGDTFIYWYDHLHSQYDSSVANNNKLQHVVYFPVESSINLKYRHDTHFSTLFNKGSKEGDNFAKQLRETDNSIMNINGTDYETGLTNLYLYNTVYSQTTLNKTFAAKPFNWIAQQQDKQAIRYSNVKINGEEKDSFTVFATYNIARVETAYGELNKLVNFKNEVFAFQDNAFCIVPINEQTFNQSDIGTAIVTGSGSVIGDKMNYRAGSTQIGSQGNNDIIQSLQALYWVDINKKKIYRFSGSTDSLSDIKGLSAYFRKTISNKTVLRGIYDNQYGEVNLTLTNNKGDDYTISYNEMLDCFVSFYSFIPTIYIKTPSNIIHNTYKPNNISKYLFLHNIGLYNKYQDEYFDSIIETIITPEGAVPKQFDNLEWSSEVYDSDGEEHTVDDNFKTVDKMYVSNTYVPYDTNAYMLIPYNPTIHNTLYTNGIAAQTNTLPSNIATIRRRNRNWHSIIPRAVQSNNRLSYRYRDMFLKLKFIFVNYDNDYLDKRLVLHDIITYFNNISNE